MKNIFKPLKKTLLSSAVAATLLASSAQADCTYQLFTISSIKGTQIGEFVDQLSDECAFTVIVTDPEAEKLLGKELNKTNLKNLTVDEVLDLVLKENNLFYNLENNILHISYLVTRTFDIDYIITTRKSVGTTGVTLSSGSGGGQGRAGGGGLSGGGGAAGAGGAAGGGAGSKTRSDSTSGIKIESVDEVSFWEDLDLELQAILNRPEDDYSADAPIINKTAGLVTVSATPRQLKRLEIYLKEVQRKAKAQVLIDVKLLGVQLNNKHETGVDWSQLYALQNFSINTNNIFTDNVISAADGTISEWGSGVDADGNQIGGKNNAFFRSISATGSLDEVVKFLQTQGNVKAISNPKIMTLNNQPALISVGSEYFYKIQQTQNQQGSGGGVANTLQNDLVQSVFAGILLDITPEIDDDGRITLKINPSLSETIQTIQPSDDGSTREVPPDLNRRQLSAVVSVQDGERVILGGLISSQDSINENKLPLLGDIPILGWLFKYEEKVNRIEELVIVIEPHIIKDGKQTISLSDLGYSGLNEDQLDSQAFIRSDSQEDFNMLDEKNAELEAEQVERDAEKTPDKASSQEDDLKFETE
ncbi:pilus (MSHA type) biogenesis protein MshL [Sulfurimonas sp. MAG313]|nr:pilus (MSHA type) biogenesis protein MshL [Sulfurimonas sp. MAG313]MDF1881887.1 pilus (MSHA type) biogenesis protein MshL [Sulfurimonas sp. MAG313]